MQKLKACLVGTIAVFMIGCGGGGTGGNKSPKVTTQTQAPGEWPTFVPGMPAPTLSPIDIPWVAAEPLSPMRPNLWQAVNVQGTIEGTLGDGQVYDRESFLREMENRGLHLNEMEIDEFEFTRNASGARVKIPIGNYHLQLSAETHEIKNCMASPNVAHLGITVTPKGKNNPKYFNFHLGAYKNAAQQTCVGVYVTKNPGTSYYATTSLLCKNICFPRPPNTRDLKNKAGEFHQNTKNDIANALMSDPDIRISPQTALLAAEVGMVLFYVAVVVPGVPPF